VHSLHQQHGGTPAEIVLVDNGSREDFASLHDPARGVRVLRLPHNRGFAGGANAGIAAARHPVVVVMNNDTLAARNLLLELAHVHRRHREAGAIAPVSNLVKGAAQIPVTEDTRDPAARERLAASLATAPLAHDATTLSGLCLWLPREVLDRVGGFDERFGHGNFEDDDFCLRLRLHGYRLLLARRAFLHHEGHATFRSLGLDLDAELRRRRRQFEAKWAGDPAGRATVAALGDDVLAAEAAAADARAAWPLWPDTHWHLGRGAMQRGDFTLAASHFRQLLQHCPQHVEARLAQAACLLRGENPDAGAASLAALADEPLSPPQEAFLREHLGEHHYRRGDAAAAEREFRRVLTLHPDPSGKLRNWHGVALAQAGRLDEAVVTLRAAAAAGLGSASTNLGLCHLLRGDTAAAGAAFAAALQRSPADAVARHHYDALEPRSVPRAATTA
jgi:GT2 family glycosyltransferase/Flp pilus assembly protein TadD